MRRKLNLKFRVGVACLVAMLGLYLGAAFSPRTANAQTLCEQDACDPGYLWDACYDNPGQWTGCDFYGSGWPDSFCYTYACPPIIE